ncbi:hypothetical protein SAY86_010739 [Trapa natans]|uniref:pyridoxal 5'-phosphate synthase n=1 Tax=Trapa natans TaxID=22666 RepID=A0AAN7LWX4_TRANT|nr:hypothetical protein SAY86_010739 [Trapa natans]
MASSAATAPWKQLLLNALESNSHLKHSSFLQLATVGSNGRPSNRTVVFRGFQESSDKIQIHTDRRSRKVEDLRQCPLAEICWYFADSWEQFRINGRVEMIDEANQDSLKLELREKAWHSCSTRSRLQYLGPSPGLPCLSEESTAEASLDPSIGPVASFCLLILDPEQVDYLNLKTNQRLAFMSKKSADEVKGWALEKINP